VTAVIYVGALPRRRMAPEIARDMVSKGARVVSLGDVTWDTALFGAVAKAVWAAGGMMGAIRYALNRAWDVEKSRSFVRGKAMDVLLVFCVSVVVVLSLALTIAARSAPAVPIATTASCEACCGSAPPATAACS